MTGQSPWKTLSKLMEDTLSLDDIHDVLFAIHIDKDNLPRTKSAAIRELIDTTYRKRNLTELIAYLHEIRPNVDWPSAEALVHAKRPKQVLPSSTNTYWVLLALIFAVISVIAIFLLQKSNIFNPQVTITSEPTIMGTEIVEEAVTGSSASSLDINLTQEAISFIDLTMELAGGEIEKGTTEGYQAAAVIFDDAIEHRPDIARLHYELGRAYYNIATKQSNPDEKIEIFSTNVLESLTNAINLDSSDANAFRLRGRAYINIKDYLKAVADFERVVALNNNDIEAQIFLGQAYIGANRNDDAIALFSSLIEMESDNGEFFCWRGAAHSKNRDFEMAQADFNSAMALTVTSSSACDLDEELQLLQERKAG